MSTATPGESFEVQVAIPKNWTVADLQKRLGGIPAERIRLYPPPGFATERHVTEIHDRENRLFELQDGILVEKGMGAYESLLAVIISTEVSVFLRTHNLGRVLGADGTLRILPGIVKIPDVSFVSWDRWPTTLSPIPDIVPDLAIEVLSQSNTVAEMEIKLNQYFEAGVRLVWYVDPPTKSARSFICSNNVTEIQANGILDGAEVLPGFELSLQALFDEADRQRPTA